MELAILRRAHLGLLIYISFTDNAGLFIGSSVEGSYLQPRNDFNRILYDKDLDSDEILKSIKPKKEIKNI